MILSVNKNKFEEILLPFVVFILFVTSVYTRTPTLFFFRRWDAIAVIIAAVFLLVLQLRSFKKRKISISLLIALVFIILFVGYKEARFAYIKQQVLRTNSDQLEELGQHYIVGYTDKAEVENLISKKGIAGIFITIKNITNKSSQEIKQEIDEFQKLRTETGLPPLLIATDQEGGIVSRMSPPLNKLPALSSLVEKYQGGPLLEEVKKYASLQASDLLSIGVNLNFAPVVDIDMGVHNPKDKYSLISGRAISKDKDVVAQVATIYSKTLEDNGVIPTAKHFPGLGRVPEDTHVSSAVLDVPVSELEKEDWIPFKHVANNTESYIMLSHVILSSVDPDHPVSFSHKVISEIIRGRLGINNKLVTDDFSMGAVYSTKDGIQGATVKALDAGVDYILISYDTDLYYESMYAALNNF